MLRMMFFDIFRRAAFRGAALEAGRGSDEAGKTAIFPKRPEFARIVKRHPV